MSAQNEDFLFAQEAQNLGYVTEAQVEEGFLLQQRMAEDLQIDERLAVILVKRGWLADEQARRVYGIIEPEGAIHPVKVFFNHGHTVHQHLNDVLRGVASNFQADDFAPHPSLSQALFDGDHQIVGFKVA